MGKKYIDKDVYTAAMERVAYLFAEFDNIVVAFSGGKDSTLCLNLCYQYAKQHNCLDKLSMYHLDYEAQYQMTTDFVTQTFNNFADIHKEWYCVPIEASCGCCMDKGTWTPWAKQDKEIWVRQMPDTPSLITEDNCPIEIRQGEQDYSFQERLSKYYGTKGKTAVVIGIRTDESLNRYVAVAKDNKVANFKGIKWITAINKSTVNAYPVYDWLVEDIWAAYAKFGWKYNKLYDLFYYAGVPLADMRVASAFHCCGMFNLRLYKVIDPNTWAKMVGRVNGVNFAAIYGDTTAMGWKNIKLPANHTWKSYYHFLLSTMNKATAEHYDDILRRSKEYWKRGGSVSQRTLKELEGGKYGSVYRGKSTRYEDREIVSFTEYPDDIDCTEFAGVPSYKRMCVCIMKNDYYCKYAGYGFTKEAMVKRKNALEKYKNL